MDNVIALVAVIFGMTLCVVACLNGIGYMNEDLEYLQPKMRRVKLNRFFIKIIPQWGKNVGLNPKKYLEKKCEIYILIAVLALSVYINAIVWIAASTIVWFLVGKTAFVYCFFGSLLPFLVITVLTFYIDMQVKKKERQQFMKLEKDFDMPSKPQGSQREAPPERKTQDKP